MSLSRLRSQLEYNSSVSDLNIRLRKTPVLLSDSKARHLRDEVARGIEKDIVWWYKGGATTEKQYDFLCDNLEIKLHRYPDIVLYLWLGTCDLTVKQHDGLIELKSRDKSSANDLIKQFRDIYTFLRGFPTVEPVLLELPPYSISEYNRHKGREDTKYRDDDKILHEHIRIVNTFVRETNLIYRRESPRFSLDIENCRRDRYKKPRYTFRFSTFYYDGIHPISELARLWLLRICQKVSQDCA